MLAGPLERLCFLTSITYINLRKKFELDAYTGQKKNMLYRKDSTAISFGNLYSDGIIL